MKRPRHNRGRVYYDLTQPKDDGFARCGRNREPAPDHAEYLAHYPRCVTSSWLKRVQDLSPAEAALRIEYAILSKQVAVMEACQLPGHPGHAVSVDPPDGDLAEQVEELRALRNGLLKEIQNGSRCSDSDFRPATVGGPGLNVPQPGTPAEAALLLREVSGRQALDGAAAALLLGHTAWAVWVAVEGAGQHQSEAVAGILSLWSLLRSSQPDELASSTLAALRSFRAILLGETWEQIQVALLPAGNDEQSIRAIAAMHYILALVAAVDYLHAVSEPEGTPSSHRDLLGRVVREGLAACIHGSGGDFGPDACLRRWAQILG